MNMHHHHAYSLSLSQSTTTNTIIQIQIPISSHHLQPPFVHKNLLFLTFPHRFPTPRNFKHRQRHNRVGVHVRASGKQTPFEVLGVPPSATTDQIKRAYRKLALKYHPDVNKEANAQEKFMRIKHAYNTLLSSNSRTGYNSGNPNSDFSSSTTRKTWSPQAEEEFYGFGDFFQDLQEEYQNWEADASAQGKPKSLWEELAEIGEEFVEFLEKELNISDEDGDVEGSSKEGFDANQRGNHAKNKTGEGNSIKESIDEIEAALSQLKKELGL